ncbi:hypothetical protein EYM_05525 [Ignicoccus islandicus DSM 13165]|uniref:Uncharacterized protein n=1 Tax=Ignicoccus islandicus DSM 13165 TaxID=940295 RepID=A0A0U3FT24_9CREN|nr:hypothetical protein [Ignicoccus islandicus]ALU12592.1 hypothetical protein EYM_05525 [Ignicoccus islandicus DSM 13165]
MESEWPLRDYILMIAVVVLLLTSLGVLNFAFINYSTHYEWMPYVAGPIVGAVYLISLIIPLVSRSYTLYMLGILVFMIPTLLAYVITYDDSSIYGYEDVAFLLVLDLLFAMLLHRMEGTDSFTSSVTYSISISLVALTSLIAVTISFRNGTVYQLDTQSLLLLSSIASFLSVISTFTLKKSFALTSLLINYLLILIIAVSINFVYPDVTIWMFLAPLLGINAIPAYLIYVYGVES